MPSSVVTHYWKLAGACTTAGAPVVRYMVWTIACGMAVFVGVVVASGAAMLACRAVRAAAERGDEAASAVWCWCLGTASAVPGAAGSVWRALVARRKAIGDAMAALVVGAMVFGLMVRYPDGAAAVAVAAAASYYGWRRCKGVTVTVEVGGAAAPAAPQTPHPKPALIADVVADADPAPTPAADGPAAGSSPADGTTSQAPADSTAATIPAAAEGDAPARVIPASASGSSGGWDDTRDVEPVA